MPKVTASYNGWTGQCRTIRGTKFYRMLDKGEIKRSGKCSMCGTTKAPLQFHGEQYGPTWEDYLAATHEICCHCHGMIHIRFRFPRAWKHYIKAITEEGPQMIFFNMGAIFGFVKDKGQPPISFAKGNEDIPLIKTGNDFIDSIPAEPYKGKPRIPTKIVQRGNMTIEAPDWDCLTDEQREELQGKQLTMF